MPIFKTATGVPLVFPSSGTGCWEAALTNCLDPGAKVLIASFGQFSSLWADMAKRLGFRVIPAGEPLGRRSAGESLFGCA